MATRAKTRSFAGFSQVGSSIRGLQKEGEKLLGRVRKEAARLVSRDRRKALENLVEQANRLRADLQDRVERTVREIERRAERILSRFETQAEKSFGPIIRRLNLPSRADVEALGKRLASLEKRVEEIVASRSHAA